MTAYQSLVSINGTSTQVPAADSLLVGKGVDTVDTSGANSILTLGAANATEIVIKTINGVGTGDITIDAGNGSSNLLSLEGANVNVTTQANGSIQFAPGANGNIYIDGGVSGGRVGLGTYSPTVGFDVRAQTLFRNPSDSTTALEVQNAATTTVFDVDTTNARVGIGTNAPAFPLDVQGNVAGTLLARVYNSSSGANARAQLRAAGDTAGALALVSAFGSGSGLTQFNSVSTNDAAMFSADEGASRMFVASQGTTTPLLIGTASNYAGGVAIEVAANHGNVTVNPDGEAGIDFIVEGDTNADLLHVDASADAVGIGVAAPSTVLHVDSNAANTTPILTLENTAGDFQVFRVDATPEGAVTGSVGDLANDTTGGTLYLKTSGSATNTGWTALATGSSSLTVGTTPIVSGTANRILYQDGSNVLQESGNLTFDGSTFSVNANANALTASVVIANSDNGANSGQFVNVSSGPSGLFQFGATGTGTNLGADVRTGGAALLIASGGYDLKQLALSSNFRWYDGFQTVSHLMSLTPTGLGINTDTPTAKLDVRGTVLAQSTSNSATAFQVQTSGAATVLNVDTANERVGIGTTSPDWQLDVEGSTAAVVSRVYNTSSGAGAIAQGRVSANGTDVGALVNAYGSANGGTQFQSISLNDGASFTTDTGVANLFISTRNATAPIHIGTNSDVIGPRAIEIAANQGNVTVNPDGAAGVDFIVEGDTNADLLYVDASADAVGIGLAAPSTVLHVDSNAANTTAILTLENTAGDFQVFRVDATPESSVTGSVGDLANDTTNGVLYLKTSGSATNTGWTALATGGGGPATGVEIPFNTSAVLAGEAVYCWAAGSANPASAAAPTAPEYRTARVIGICTGTPAVSGKVAVSGLVNATFIGGLTFVAGDPVYLSKTGGSLTTDVSSGAGFGTGDAVAEIGIVTDVLSYNGTSNLTAQIAIQPKAITIL